MKSVRPPFFFRWFSPGYLVCSLPASEKAIYLTFDDGPVPDVTTAVLKILDDFNAKATFFVVGDNVRKHPEILTRVTSGGHALGNHTYHHLNGWKTPAGAYAEDVFRCNDLFKTRLFRPPYGRFTPAQYFLLKKKFRFILWSVLTRDFDRETTPAECLHHAIVHGGNGEVVVFHDSEKSASSMLYALPRFLEHFSIKGFRFMTLEEARIL